MHSLQRNSFSSSLEDFTSKLLKSKTKKQHRNFRRDITQPVSILINVYLMFFFYLGKKGQVYIIPYFPALLVLAQDTNIMTREVIHSSENLFLIPTRRPAENYPHNQEKWKAHAHPFLPAPIFSLQNMVNERFCYSPADLPATFLPLS